MVNNAEEMGEASEYSAEEAQKVISTLEETLDPLADLTAAWDAHNAMLETTITDYELLGETIQKTLEAIGEIPNGGASTTPSKTSGSTSDGVGTKGGITSDEINAGLTEQYEAIVAMYGQAVGIPDMAENMLTMQQQIE